MAAWPVPRFAADPSQGSDRQQGRLDSVGRDRVPAGNGLTVRRAASVHAPVRTIHRKEAATMTPSNPVRRVLVGSALRRYRQGIGYSLEDAAEVLECDRS